MIIFLVATVHYLIRYLLISLQLFDLAGCSATTLLHFFYTLNMLTTARRYTILLLLGRYVLWSFILILTAGTYTTIHVQLRF